MSLVPPSTWCRTPVPSCFAQSLSGASPCAHRVVMVLGAGRGPLVHATLRASRQAARRVRVYAVEKNPNAIVT